MSHYDSEWERIQTESISEAYKEALEYRTEQGLYDMKVGTKCDRNKALESLNGAVSSTNKYSRALRGGATLDVYDVLDAFKVDNPAVQHALKKMLCAGSRGHKDYMQDIQEAIDSLERAKSFAPIPF
jgi:hypothetical protein